MSEAVVAKKPIADILPFMMKSKNDDCNELAPNDLHIADDANTKDIFKAAAHNQAFEHLCNFAEASALPTLVLPESFGEGHLELPIQSATEVLRATVSIYDLVSLAAFIHKHLILPSSRGVLIPPSALFGQLTLAISHFSQMMSDLESVLTSAAATQAESGGWELTPSMGMLKEWRKTFCIFLRGALESAVASFVAALRTATHKCRDATPAWEACIVGSSFDLEMSKKLVGAGRLPSIVSAYNEVHSILKQMNMSAQVLHISPRLQEHDASREPIAIAFAAMSSAMTAAICAMGLEILDMTGSFASRKAKLYLNQNRNHASAKVLPPAFWAEFEALASLSAPSSALPASATPASSPLVPIAAAASSVACGDPRGDTVADPTSLASKAASDAGESSGNASGSRRGLKRIRKS